MSIFAQALEFEAGQRNWLLQQDALHTAASVRLRQQVAASQAAVEAQRTNQLADWAAEEQEQALRHHQASTLQPQVPTPKSLLKLACIAVACLCFLSGVILDNSNLGRSTLQVDVCALCTLSWS